MWYDAYWLESYQACLTYLARQRPESLAAFTNALEPFKTDLNFKVCEIPKILDPDKMAVARDVIRRLLPSQIEMHETRDFGRFVVHNHEHFNQLQSELLPLVSELVGEAIEPSYNFLSLYSHLGSCPVHMDAPFAKWTLDICLDQSVEWPIWLGPTEPWPENVAGLSKNWAADVLQRTSFQPYIMKPGDAILFSGSSQWHYRDPIPSQNAKDHCDLVFFHYIPKGTSPLREPKFWPDYFNIPELPVAKL